MLLLKTPAKINLFLNLKHPRPDGFHEVCFVMQSVALYDTLRLLPAPPGTGLHLTCNHPVLAGELRQNLIVCAYQLFFKETGLPPLDLEVQLDKEIPIQAGLGGGSSDAAAMLKALNQLTQANLSLAQLQTLAATLGSDAPFFLTAQTALATGRGEIIQPLSVSLPAWPLLLLKPKTFGISTPLAYQAVRNANRYQTVSPAPLLAALQYARIPQDLEPYLLNDFEDTIFPHYPALQEIQEHMRTLGIRRPLLCGSGPTMAGFWEPTPENQTLLKKLFPTEAYDVFPTQLCTHGLPVVT